MTETIFGNNVFDMHLDFFVWSMSHLLTWRVGTYHLYCNQPPGGQDILASFMRSCHVVHIVCGSNRGHSHFAFVLNTKWNNKPLASNRYNDCVCVFVFSWAWNCGQNSQKTVISLHSVNTLHLLLFTEVGDKMLYMYSLVYHSGL